MFKNPLFDVVLGSLRIISVRSVGFDHPVARNDQTDIVVGHHRAHGPGRVGRLAGQDCQLAVAHLGAESHLSTNKTCVFKYTRDLIVNDAVIF